MRVPPPARPRPYVGDNDRREWPQAVRPQLALLGLRLAVAQGLACVGWGRAHDRGTDPWRAPRRRLGSTPCPLGFPVDWVAARRDTGVRARVARRGLGPQDRY